MPLVKIHLPANADDIIAHLDATYG